MFEIAEAMNKEGALCEWASKVNYGIELNPEEREFSEAADQWARELGKTGKDSNGELSALFTKALTVDEVTAPSELISRMFDESNIDEFDDTHVVQDPKNTIQVHETIDGGNVDRSFVEHKIFRPTWKTLAAETDISMQELRRGGYHTVANYVNYMKEAFEAKRVGVIMNAIDAAIVSGAANYIAESTAMPTATSMDALALYLMDMSDGSRPLAFSLNKYRQAISKLAQANRWPTEADKGIYNMDGFLRDYAGVELLGFSGQKKTSDNALLVPDKRVFGIAAKIGSAITRGEARTMQQEDINQERIHVKVAGFTFGYVITNIENVAKIVMAS